MTSITPPKKTRQQIKTETFGIRVQEGSMAGVTYLGPADNSNYGRYRVDNCGHEKEIQYVDVRRGSFQCQICLRLERERIAQATGQLRYLGKGEKRNSGTYLFTACGHIKDIQYGCVLRGKFHCDQCIKLRWEQEAFAAGFEIVGPGRNTNYLTYRFLSCGHEQEIQVAHVGKQKGYKCKSCQELQYSADARRARLTYLECLGVYNGLYRFNKCGHEQKINKGCVAKGTFKCEQCHEELRLQQESAAGVTLLKSLSDNRGRYRFIKCGHVRVLLRSCVSRNQVQCKTCIREREAKDAQHCGCTLLKQTTTYYALYRCDNCGHQRELQKSLISSGRYNCPQCTDSWTLRPSNIYLSLINNCGYSWLKLGYAEVPEIRYVGYGLPKTAGLQELMRLPMPTGAQARAVEEAIHSKFKDEQIAPEWALKLGMRRNGTTECYPVGMLEELSAAIREVEYQYLVDKCV